MTARVDAVVSMFGDILAALAPDVDVSRATSELGSLVERPWDEFCDRGLRRGSALTDTGAPFELSLKFVHPDDLAVRYVVDVADTALALADNYERYLEAARRTTGLPDSVLGPLFVCHLDDAPPMTPATVMHGVGWATGGDRRSTLYFPSSWLTPDELAKRLPEAVPLPEQAEVVGYDFTDGRLTTWKTYHWIPAPVSPLSDETGFAASRTAAAIHERFSTYLTPSTRGKSTFLQRRFAGSARVTDSFFFFGRPWGFADSGNMTELLGLLDSIGWDLHGLRVLADCARGHGLPLHVGLIAASGDDSSITFYLWPG